MHRLRHALDEFEAAAADNLERELEIQRRLARLREQLDLGRPIAEVVSAEETPRVVELLTITLSTLDTVGSRLRAELAIALRKEGLTIEAIATLFGVTRQRISTLLRRHGA